MPGTDAAGRLQVPWGNGLSDEMSAKEIEVAHRVLNVLRDRPAVLP
ncbi:hypothetical protein JQ543_32795 [Bradyrhizobium diazoefficiens]|nr:hypothetical protein [Bradyrhizobium diazoefficiens]MBR0852548.1 hypothetical protein [Bradyrhizobium diazoefficiens]